MRKVYKWKEAQKILKNNNSIIYLWFGTDWCGDCRMMEPIIEEVMEQFSNNNEIKFIKVDAEEAKLFRVESPYKVFRVPTHVLIKGKKIREIFYEYIPAENLILEINKLRYEK